MLGSKKKEKLWNLREGPCAPIPEWEAQSMSGEGGKPPGRVRGICVVSPCQQSSGHRDFPLPHHGIEIAAWNPCLQIGCGAQVGCQQT